ncbi:MAG: hypothetical protein GWN79_29135, partial [Actinobacteria bacterium]|nr:hypothetical protein [Actinomycetota bacterium]NIW33768.1 hypothetical protein [Actinomycetota bacterium]
MRSTALPVFAAAALLALAAPAPIHGQADSRLDDLKEEALRMVEEDAEMV